jgi:hypothetical protein
MTDNTAIVEDRFYLLRIKFTLVARYVDHSILYRSRAIEIVQVFDGHTTSG